jgi:hypothetical protein
MFTLTVQDEQVYRRLMARVEQRGESLDDVLRELLEQDDQVIETPQVANVDEDEKLNEERPIRKLLKLIDASNLVFNNPIDGRDAEDIMRREAGDFSWRDTRDDNGTT